jgi:hypothetical protein
VGLFVFNDLAPFSFRANRKPQTARPMRRVISAFPSVLKNSIRRPPVRQENVRLSAARPVLDRVRQCAAAIDEG